MKELKSKSEMMRRLYQQRKKSGLIQYRAWINPKNKEKIDEFIKEIGG